MPCYRPITLASGQVVPCTRHCIQCRLLYAFEWATRCTHEASLYTHNCFVTLTYDDRRLPAGYDVSQGLIYRHFQKDFLDALRARCGGFDVVKHHKAGAWDAKHNKPYPDFHRPIRYYMAGEYGDLNMRPHWHALLFNFDFSDKYYWRTSDNGDLIYRSPTLEELWPYGNSDIGSVTFKSAGYVARYANKKVYGDLADKHYNGRVPEFCRQSRKPGLGSGWFDKYWSDVYPNDFVVVNGRKRKPPRFYDKLFTRLTGEMMPVAPFVDLESGELFERLISPTLENLKFDRSVKAKSLLDKVDAPSLLSQEQVHLARVRNLKRNL